MCVCVCAYVHSCLCLVWVGLRKSRSFKTQCDTLIDANITSGNGTLEMYELDKIAPVIFMIDYRIAFY